MTPTAGFASFLVLTLALLGTVVATGRAGRRRLHVSLVVLTLAALGTAIFYAEKLGELYDLETAGVITPIHLFIAKLTTACYLLPVITGVRTWRDGRSRPLHRRVAYLVMALTVVTALTGTSMVLLSERIA